MDYFALLNLRREPFSNSPDPDFFYKSRQHQTCLQQLELALRLRRGLNVVLGDVGTGKSTLCRELIRRFAREERFETHLILDPDYAAAEELLCSVLHKLEGRRPPEGQSAFELRERIKSVLFDKGVEGGQVLVLLIDEGQKIPAACLEILRELLNFETNAQKLLQIVIFAQREFERSLAAHPNFADRVNLLLRLGPLSWRDTAGLVRFRLEHASSTLPAAPLFTPLGVLAIQRASQGYPRQIVHLCHHSLLALIIQNQRRVGWRIASACAGRTLARPRTRLQRAALGLLGCTALVALLVSVALRPWGDGIEYLGAPLPPRPSATLEHSPAAAVAGKGAELSATALASAESGGRDATTLPAMTRADPAAPLMLGELAVIPGETLSRLIQMIYGVFAPPYLELVRGANPHLADLDRLGSGSRVAFPCGPARVDPDAWWVSLGEHSRLDAAVAQLRTLEHTGPRARLIARWKRDAGLRFDTVLQYPLASERAALHAVASLPPEQQALAKLLHGGGAEAVLFGELPSERRSRGRGMTTRRPPSEPEQSTSTASGS
jgi:general secretion pathway protein A